MLVLALLAPDPGDHPDQGDPTRGHQRRGRGDDAAFSGHGNPQGADGDYRR
jgi:hypothetical protein